MFCVKVTRATRLETDKKARSVREVPFQSGGRPCLYDTHMAMELAEPINQADLVRDPGSVIEAVRRGQPAVVKTEGGADVALVDLIDFRLLRAVARAQTDPLNVGAVDTGIPASVMERAADTQERFDLVLAYYMAEAISLGRAAEVLGLVWVDLRDRFVRLGVPLRLGPQTDAELKEELEAARTIEETL